LQGAILFNDNTVLQQMQQEWNANISQAAGNQIRVELWRVNYVPDKNSGNFTDILLTEKLDANVSYQPGQNSIGYNINYMPVTGNVVIIAYSVLPGQRGNFRNARTVSNLNPNIQINGKPNDGMPASMAHQFKSDAKKYLGNNIIYGIYSVPQRTNSLSNANFQVGLPSDPNCKNCDWVSDAWDKVKDIANEAANTANDVANDVANLVKTTADGTVTALNGALKEVGESIVANSATFFVQAFGTIATFVQNGDLPQARMLSDKYYGNAYAIANSTIFMGSLPPANKIIVTNMVSINERMFTLPVKVGDDMFILMNMGKGFNDPLNFNRNGYPGDVFIHELTHAWQIWHIDVLKLVQDGAVNQFRNTVISDQYHYDCDGHNLTDGYNEEQQANIVEHFYTMLFSGYTVINDKNGKPATCGFEQQWTVQNILGSQPANINAQFTATGKIRTLSVDQTIAGYTGGADDLTLAFPSNGNKTDGTGYYLQGKINNSVFYYSNKSKITCANWGPVRDKFVKENYEFGELGWPEANEAMLRDGAGFSQKFNHGYIYWHPKYGAHAVLNKINDAWKTTGSEAGRLGYPISDYFSLNQPTTNKQAVGYSDKGYQKFAGGVIFYDMSSLNTLATRGDQNFATINYGDPDRLVAMHYAMSTGPRKAEEVTVTQQAQPGGAKPSPGSTVQRRADAVELNPQPLPPKNTGAVSKKPQSTKVQLNPQPLPPKN
jgi:hypothetical protein